MHRPGRRRDDQRPQGDAQPVRALLARTWQSLKQVMGPGTVHIDLGWLKRLNGCAAWALVPGAYAWLDAPDGSVPLEVWRYEIAI